MISTEKVPYLFVLQDIQLRKTAWKPQQWSLVSLERNVKFQVVKITPEELQEKSRKHPRKQSNQVKRSFKAPKDTLGIGYLPGGER